MVGINRFISHQKWCIKVQLFPRILERMAEVVKWAMRTKSTRKWAGGWLPTIQRIHHPLPIPPNHLHLPPLKPKQSVAKGIKRRWWPKRLWPRWYIFYYLFIFFLYLGRGGGNGGRKETKGGTRTSTTSKQILKWVNRMEAFLILFNFTY